MDRRLRELERRALAGDKDAAEQLYGSLLRIPDTDPALLRKLHILIHGRRPLSAYDKFVTWNEILDVATGKSIDYYEEWIHEVELFESLDEQLENIDIDDSIPEAKVFEAALYAIGAKAQKVVFEEIVKFCENYTDQIFDQLEDAANAVINSNKPVIKSYKVLPDGIEFRVSRRLLDVHDAVSGYLAHKVFAIDGRTCLIYGREWARMSGTRLDKNLTIDFGNVYLDQALFDEALSELY